MPVAVFRRVELHDFGAAPPALIGDGEEQLQLAARVDGTRTKIVEARERHLILPI